MWNNKINNTFNEYLISMGICVLNENDEDFSAYLAHISELLPLNSQILIPTL